MTDPTLRPFNCRYTPQVPELLHRLGCTLVISTYQAGKVLMLSAPDENSLVQLPRTFPKPMGIAGNGEKLAVATRNSVLRFANSPQLAMHYPKSPSTYDAMFLPRVTYHTGQLDIHDLRIGSDDRIYAVNTLFSCIAVIDDEYSFRPWWTPPFIDKLSSEDRCHLNGMAMRRGLPAFASMFGEGNSTRSWVDTLMDGGVVYDVESGSRVVSGLAMPHSPRLYEEGLFILLSGTGELARIDIEGGKVDAVARIGGFVRGLARCGDHLFVGLSKIRQKSSSFGKLAIAASANEAGVAIIHLPSGSLVGKIVYTASVDEIYDLHIIEGVHRPNILNTSTDIHNRALMTPSSTYWAREIGKRS